MIASRARLEVLRVHENEKEIDGWILDDTRLVRDCFKKYLQRKRQFLYVNLLAKLWLENLDR